MDVFQGLPSNSVPLCLTSWENQTKSAKTSEKELYTSTCLVVTQPSGETISNLEKRVEDLSVLLNKAREQLTVKTNGSQLITSCLVFKDVLFYLFIAQCL